MTLLTGGHIPHVANLPAPADEAPVRRMATVAVALVRWQDILRKAPGAVRIEAPSASSSGKPVGGG